MLNNVLLEKNTHMSSCYMHDDDLSHGSLYYSILHMRIKVWGLIESVKKGGFLLIMGIETTQKGQLWTCMGALVIVIIHLQLKLWLVSEVLASKPHVPEKIFDVKTKHLCLKQSENLK